MKYLKLASVLLCMLLGAGCPVADTPVEAPGGDSLPEASTPAPSHPGATPSGNSTGSDQARGLPAGACCLRDGCFVGVTAEQCYSAGGGFLDSGDCAECGGTPLSDIMAVLRLMDTDRDGRNDAEELQLGTDPRDPTDGPDIDGDGQPNAKDRDVDGDQIFNAYDDDVDGDGILNKLDNDIDADGEANAEDSDDDGDGAKDDADDDDDADGDDDEDDDDEDEDDEAKEKDKNEEDFDLLALARRLFDDEADQAKAEDFDLLALANRLFDDAEEKPEEFDLLGLANRFFDEAIDETRAAEERALDEERTYQFFRTMFDEDGDGLLNAVDPDPDGNGSRDDDNDGKDDLTELRAGAN